MCQLKCGRVAWPHLPSTSHMITLAAINKWHPALSPSPSPQDTPLHAHDLSLSRGLSPGSLTKRQGLYVDCPTIHPVICLSELSSLFCLQGPEPSTAMYRQLHTAVYDWERTPPFPSPVWQHHTVHQEAVSSRSLSGRQVALWWAWLTVRPLALQPADNSLVRRNVCRLAVRPDCCLLC